MTTDPYQPDLQDESPDSNGDITPNSHADQFDPGEPTGDFDGDPDDLPPVFERVFRALRAGAEAGPGGAEGLDPLRGAVLDGGKYRLCTEIGRGGFGVVYEAEQCKLLRRQVAIKIAEGTAHDPRFADRLRDEQQTLAALDDPSIVRVLDSGVTPKGFPGGSGRQYLVMDLVRGVPITAYCEREGLGLSDRLLLLADAARAVAAAHRRGVLHRDLKPAHILVDEAGHVRLIDFGMARLLEGDRLSRTVTGQSIGTPRYMSPEQRAGHESKIDNRVDVYALGMVLAELVLGPGALAFDPATIARVPASELLERAKTTHQMQAGPARRWRRACRTHVDWVLHKALADAPAKRYKSANDLRVDLVCTAKGEAVSAKPGSSWLLLRAFVRRRPVLSTTTAVLMLVMVVGMPMLTLLSMSNARLARLAVQEAEAARFETLIARLGAAKIALGAGSHTAAREHLDSVPVEHRGWLWKHLWYRSSAQGRTLFSLSAPAGMAKSRLKSISIDPTGQLVSTVQSTGQVFILDATTGRVVAEHELLNNEVYTVRFSPKPGGPLAIGGWVDTLWLVDPDDPKAAPRAIQTPQNLIRLCFSPDGSVLAAGSATSPEVYLFSIPMGELLATLRLDGGLAYALAFDSQGERLYMGTDTGWIETWDLGMKTRLATGRYGTSRIHSIERSPTDERLGACFSDGSLMLLLPEPDGSLRLEARVQGIRGFLECAFSNDGTTLYTAGFDTTITAWSVPHLEQRRTWRQHEDHIYSLRVHPTDGTIYSCGLDGTVRILDPARQHPAIEHWSTVSTTKTLTWDPLGRFVLSPAPDRSTTYDRLTHTQTTLPVLKNQQGIFYILSRRGDVGWTEETSGNGWIAWVDGDSTHFPNTADSASAATDTPVTRQQGKIRIRAIVDGVAVIQYSPTRLGLYDRATDVLQDINMHDLGVIHQVALSPSSDVPLVIRSGLNIFTADHAGILQHLAHITTDNRLDLARNGRWLLVYARETSEAWVYDLHTRQLAHHLPARSRGSTSAAISADGRLAAFGKAAGDIDMMHTEKDRVLTSFIATDSVQSVAFDEEGSLWARSYSGTSHVWRLGPGNTPTADTPRDSAGEQLFEPLDAALPGPIDHGG